MGLKQQVIKGVSWNFFEQVTRQLVSVAVTTILARILVPNDYGLVALSSIFVGFVCLFESLSIGSAIIQRTNLDERYISTSFWTSVFTGITLLIIMFAIAPLAANYYEQPRLTVLIDVAAITVLISPVTSTHKMLLSKKMEFGKLSAINIFVAVINSVSSLILAVYGMGVWSLVLGGLIANILVIPLVWCFEKWRPQFIFDKKCFSDLFSFSSYLLSSNVVFYFARNADNLVVGKFLGANALGIYSMAYNLMMKPLQQISWSITAVLFPAFSSIQHDIVRIRTAYLKAVAGIALITFPMMMGLMVVAREFILVMVGQKWTDVIMPLQVLCLVGALQSVGTTVGSIFNSLGRADLQFKTGTINSIGHVIGFLICIRWGIMGLVKGYLLTNIIFISVTQLVAVRLIKLSIVEFLAALKMPAINSMIMVMILYGYKYINARFIGLNMYLTFVSTVGIGIVVYIFLTLMFMDKQIVNEIKGAIKRRFRMPDVTACE